MNLGQAYQGWQQMQENRELYKNTREAFRKAWFTLPTNKPCSYYTREVLGTALAETREIESNKAKAASVMIHVLTFANWAEPKFNPKPDFTYQDLMEYTKGPLADPEKIKPAEKPSCLDDLDDTDLDIDPVTAMPRQRMEQESVDTIHLREKMHNTEFEIRRGGFEPEPEPDDEHGEDDSRDPLAGIEFPDEPNETKPEKDMEPKEKKPRGREPKPVAQLDAKTLQVIKVWPSRSEAERELGACNLDRAISRKRLSAGFFWCSPEDAGGFQPNPASKPGAEKKPGRMTNPMHAAKQKEEAGRTARKTDDVPSPTRAAAADALKVFTDEELIAALTERGWQGELTRIQRITIGRKD